MLYHVATNYCTKAGNPAARNLRIEADTSELALATATKRVQGYRSYAGKLDASVYPLTRITAHAPTTVPKAFSRGSSGEQRLCQEMFMAFITQ